MGILINVEVIYQQSTFSNRDQIKIKSFRGRGNGTPREYQQTLRLEVQYFRFSEGNRIKVVDIWVEIAFLSSLNV